MGDSGQRDKRRRPYVEHVTEVSAVDQDGDHAIVALIWCSA